MPMLMLPRNTYNALGWRTSRSFDESKGAYDGLDQRRVYSYGADWRMLEERIDIDVSTNSDAAGGTDDDTDWIAQQFWGLRYIDDAVGKRVDRDGDGDFVDADCSYWYQLSDTQFSVGVVLDWVGNVYERIEYDAYGVAGHRWGGDADGDGMLAFGDLSLNAGDNTIDRAGYHADLDVNCDGVFNTLDSGVIVGHAPPVTPALPAGWISDPSSATGPDNSIGYAGYVFNHEREDYTVRFRVYTPKLGRWKQRDPLKYIDSSNTYLYGLSNPVLYSDYDGLAAGGVVVITLGTAEVGIVLGSAAAAACLVYPPCREALLQAMADLANSVGNIGRSSSPARNTQAARLAKAARDAKRTKDAMDEIRRILEENKKRAEEESDCPPPDAKNQKDKIQDAKEAYRKNEQFRRWFHREKGNDKSGRRNYKRNDDIPDDELVEYYEMWKTLQNNTGSP